MSKQELREALDWEAAAQIEDKAANKVRKKLEPRDLLKRRKQIAKLNAESIERQFAANPERFNLNRLLGIE